MAVTTQNSTEYAKSGHVNATAQLKPYEMGGRVRVATFTHDQSGAGDATSSVALCKLPPGKVTVLFRQSGAYVNWTTASATLDLGWDAYTQLDGTAVAADPNGVDDGINVETAGFQVFGSVLTATGGVKTFDSTEGVVIRATSQDVALADGSDLAGVLLYIVD